MKIPLQKIEDPFIVSSGINLFILRLDKIHLFISGNKWYKLKYNIEEAQKQKKDTLLTFGGAYSNHIAATAAAGKEFGFKTIGIIRGAPPLPSPMGREKYKPSHTLQFAESCGMELRFVSREEYKKFRTIPNDSITQLPNHYVVPEGGTNELAVKGCAEITSLIDIHFDYVCCAVGTGGTIAGIISSLKKNQKAIGFSVLKDGGFLKNEIVKLLSSPAPLPEGDININTDYHFGGYGKYTPELLNFISDFEKANNIPLEQVYTGKMMFGIYALIKNKHFPKDSTIIAIHTGGLQGKLCPPPAPPFRGRD